MEYTIEIDYSSLQIDVSRRRMEALQQFELWDRVPVLLGVTNQYLLPQLEIGYLEFFDDPERHLYYQLLGWQWLLENLGDDRLIEEELEVTPNFDNTTTAGLFDMQHILWQDDQPPHFVPWLETVRDVARLRLPNPTDNMGGRKLSTLEEMRFLVNKFHVWLQGEPILLRVGPGWQEGPFTAALDMAGDQIFDWAEEEPNALHDLLAMITETYIEYERTVRQLVEADMAGVCIRSHGAERLSEEMYRDFVLPYSLQIYEAFPGQRRLHMWGDINHLLELLVEEQWITHLDGCGYEVDTQHLIDTAGGKVVVQGKLVPETLLNGTVEEVNEAAWEVLEAFLEVGGLVLSNGGELHPDTPMENLSSLVRTTEDFAEQS
jgi:hypothetical protein